MHHLMPIFLCLIASSWPACQSYPALPDAGRSEEFTPGGDPDGAPDLDDGPFVPDEPYPPDAHNGDHDLDDGGLDGGDEGPDGSDPGLDGGDLGPDGGDGGPDECLDLSGAYNAVLNCGWQSVEYFEITQQGCQLFVNGTFSGSGQVDQAGTLFVELFDIAISCAGVAHQSGLPFGLQCGAGCDVEMFPVQGECWSSDSCGIARSCQVSITPDGYNAYTECWYGAGPGYDNTGEYCSADLDCFSVWCLDGPGNLDFCAGLCLPVGDCPEVIMDRACNVAADCPRGFSCQDGNCVRASECVTQIFSLGTQPDGSQAVTFANLCMAETRDCTRDGDCGQVAVCRLAAAPTRPEAYEGRCGPASGTGLLGDPCGDCANGTCFFVGGELDAYCSRLCVADSDCAEPTGQFRCGQAFTQLWPDFVAPIQACVRQP